MSPTTKADQVYELSLNPSKKPKKLKPLQKSSKNLAQSLMEDEPKKRDFEGLQSTADIDRDIKDYLDANKIFK